MSTTTKTAPSEQVAADFSFSSNRSSHRRYFKPVKTYQDYLAEEKENHARLMARHGAPKECALPMIRPSTVTGRLYI